MTGVPPPPLLIVLCPLASDARYKIGNAAHPAGGRNLYWVQWSESFCNVHWGSHFHQYWAGLRWDEMCIGSWWDDEASMLCALITVSQFAGTLTLSLSLDDLGRWESSCSPRYGLIAPQAGPWVYPPVPGYQEPASDYARPSLWPSPGCEPLLLIKTKPSPSLYEFIWSPPDRSSAYCEALALQHKRDTGLSAGCPTSCCFWYLPGCYSNLMNRQPSWIFYWIWSLALKLENKAFIFIWHFSVSRYFFYLWHTIRK